MSRLLVFVCVGLLASCGFQLQGASSAPQEMQRTYIAAADQHSLFYREIRSQFQAAGVELVSSPIDATATFAITIDETSQRVLSVSARNVPTEYEVYYTIEYSLDHDERRLLDPTSLTLTRDYTFDPNLVLGKAHEEQLLREDIVKDLARIVMKQLATL